MDNQISELRQKFEERLSQIMGADELEGVRVSFLGKSGEITVLLKKMGSLAAEDRKSFGQAVNELKSFAAQRIAEKTTELKEAELKKVIEPRV